MEVSRFMSGQFEKKINEKMMYYDYVFPTEEVLKYVDDVCKIPIEKILEYIIQMDNVDITSKDVFQFSKFEDATINVCIKMQNLDNPGMNHLEVGKLLLNDMKERKDGAYVKYGENHAKTGTSLGLLQELCRTYFLSCIGVIYTQLSDEQRECLLIRLILRNSFFSEVIRQMQDGRVSMRHFLHMLSNSTYIRRRSNIKKIIQILCNSKEYDFRQYLSLIVFDE